ncbi:MAG: DoxX family protein [Longimicrobiales bacterium]
MTGALHRAAGVTHAILRIGAGLLFLCHGGQKLFGWFGGVPGMEGGTVPLVSQLGLAAVLELVGGVLLILGLLTRPVAVILVLEMVAAYVIAHLPRGLLPIMNDGEPAALYGLIFLFLAGNGAGPFSLDRARRRGKREVAEEIEELEREAVRREYRVPSVEETRLRRPRVRKPPE